MHSLYVRLSTVADTYTLDMQLSKFIRLLSDGCQTQLPISKLAYRTRDVVVFFFNFNDLQRKPITILCILF